MKKNLLVLLLSSVLLLGGCNTKNNNQSGSGGQSGKQSESETGNKKIKEIALKGSAPDKIYVTEKVATTALFVLSFHIHMNLHYLKLERIKAKL